MEPTTTDDEGSATTATASTSTSPTTTSRQGGSEWWARAWGPGDVLVATLVARTATCLCAPLASRFYRFLARFSGRRRARPGSGGAASGVTSACTRWAPAVPRCAPPPLATLVLVASTVLGIAEACSSRSTPKPRPPSPTARPNITFHTYACPPAYATWYCLNGATCFTVNIGESLLYNCECADGYMGQRCEFKDLDGSYLPSRQRVMLETASIAGGATIAVFLVVIVCIAVYIHFQRRLKDNRATCVDGSSHDLEKRPFSRDPREISVRRPHSQYQNSPDIPTAPIDESENDPQFIRVGEAPSTHRHTPP